MTPIQETARQRVELCKEHHIKSCNGTMCLLAREVVRLASLTERRLGIASKSLWDRTERRAALAAPEGMPELTECPRPGIEELLLIIAEDLAADPTEEARMSEAVLRNAADELKELRSHAQRLAAEVAEQQEFVSQQVSEKLDASVMVPWMRCSPGLPAYVRYLEQQAENGDRAVKAATELAAELEAAKSDAEPWPYHTFGGALAMRVLQSDLYPTLDDVERAECDELIARWNAALTGSQR